MFFKKNLKIKNEQLTSCKGKYLKNYIQNNYVYIIKQKKSMFILMEISITKINIILIYNYKLLTRKERHEAANNNIRKLAYSQLHGPPLLYLIHLCD